ncbi:aldose epimerase family protein [Jiella pelagia]|uniref:Aldose 1-epimerase n=1 Tax=Jiella pelagia TaxID=2986949 RepID=A0ABY7BUJ1_9HYPH|nr:aldose epimerase family protein [Jiella pelagia]WAP67462.1 galactose mutarotase [Jiella pelagia]
MSGEDVFTIEKDGMAVEVLATGASITSIRPRGAGHSMVLSLPANGYGAANQSFIGASIGRFANRIGAGRFALGGVTYTLPVNDGPNQLHGGPAGFSTRRWSLVSHATEQLVLALTSEDGDEGFPGRLEAKAIFTVLDGEEMEIVYEATSDSPTVANLTSHLYFNLDGTGDILGHRLTVHAGHYLPINETTLPTGEIVPVAGTAFDLRTARRLSERPDGLDHNFCLTSQRSMTLRPAVRLEAERSGWTLELATTEPGVQVYDGHKFDGRQSGADGRPIEPFAGLALEPQLWPDAPNRPSFSSALLLPGETYRAVSRYRFISGSSSSVHDSSEEPRDA